MAAPPLSQDVVFDVKGVNELVLAKETLEKIRQEETRRQAGDAKGAASVKRETQAIKEKTAAKSADIAAEEASTAAAVKGSATRTKLTRAEKIQREVARRKEAAEIRQAAKEYIATEKAKQAATAETTSKVVAGEKAKQAAIKKTVLNSIAASRQARASSGFAMLGSGTDTALARSLHGNPEAIARRQARSSMAVARAKQDEIAMGYKLQQQQMAEAATRARTTAVTKGETAAVTKNTASKAKNAQASRAVALAAGQFGSVRTMASSAAFHVKSLGLFGLFAAIATLRGIFSTIIAPAARFEQKLALVAKTTKMSKEETTAYGKELLTLSTRLAMSRMELVEVSIIAGQMGIRGTQNLLKFTETVGMMTRVSEIGAQRAADGIATISVAFDLPIRMAENMASALNELGNHTTANADKIIRALAKVGTGAHLLGLTFEQTSAMAATLIHSGLVPSRAGTSLKTIFLRMRTEADEISKLMGTSVEGWAQMLDKDALGSVLQLFAKLREVGAASAHDQTILIEKFFGKQHATAAQTLVNKVDLLAKTLNISTEAFRANTSIAEENARAMDNLATSADRLGKSVSNFWTKVGGAISPAIKQMTDALTKLEDFSSIELERMMEDPRSYGGVAQWILQQVPGAQLFFRGRGTNDVMEAYMDALIEEGNLDKLRRQRGRVNVAITEAIRYDKGWEPGDWKTAYEWMYKLDDAIADLEESEQKLKDGREGERPDITMFSELNAEYEAALRKGATVRALAEEDTELARLIRQAGSVESAISTFEGLLLQLEQFPEEYQKIADLLNLARIQAGKFADEIKRLEEEQKRLAEQMERVREVASKMGPLAPRIGGPVAPAGDAVPEYDPNWVDLSKIFDDRGRMIGGFSESDIKKMQESLEKQRESWFAIGGIAVDLIRDIGTMAKAMGGLGENSEAFVRSLIVGVETATKLVDEIRRVSAMSSGERGFGDIASVVGSGLGLVSSIAGMAGSIINSIKAGNEKAEAQREEFIRVSKENRERLENALESLANQLIRGQDITGEEATSFRSGVSEYRDARRKFEEAARNLSSDYDLRRSILEKEQQDLNALLKAMGLDQIDFQNTSKEAIDAFLDGILDQIVDHGAFQEGINGLLGSIQFLSKFIDQDASQSFQRFVDGIAEMESIPDWMRQALSGVDLSTEEGKQALLDMLGTWAEGFASGDIDFGGLTPTEFGDVMDFLLGLTDTTATDSIANLIGSIQRLGKYMEINAVEALNKFIGGLGEIEDVPDWMKEALSGLDLSTEEGRANLNTLLTQWAQGLDAGSLNLGGLSEADFENVMDFLQGIASGNFGDESDISTLSVRRSITDVQANAVVLLLEQMVFWTREMARKMGVTGEFEGSLFTGGVVGKTGKTDIEKVVEAHTGIGIVQDPDVARPRVPSGVASNIRIDIPGDIQLVVPIDPDNIRMGDLAGQALATKINRGRVRRI